MSINQLPTEIQPVLRMAKKIIIREYPDTKALFVIGSVADRTYNDESDIDLVCVKVYKPNLMRFLELEEKINLKNNSRKIQLIPFTQKQLSWHFDNSSTMAHSIQKGVIIYGDTNKIIQKFIKKELLLPKIEWMRYWFNHWLKRYEWARYSIRRKRRFHKKFCRKECHCDLFDDIARVTVNFCILYLETKGIVPTSKKQIIKNLKMYKLSILRIPPKIFRGIKLALKLSGKDRCLTLNEADKILLSAVWYKKQLSQALITGKSSKSLGV